jgi:glyoxylase-like metal-dependent hydrolase (beta-lactamase superfamily II)
MFGIQADDSPPPDADFEDGKPFVFDGAEFDVIHTPGHSPGGVCLMLGNRLLVGDTLFKGSVGRSDLPGGSHQVLVESVRNKLFRLPGETICLPGHGPETTLAEERASNPFVSDRAADIYLQERL